MACLGEPCPSAWMLNKNPFVQDPVHLWISYRKEEIDKSPPQGWTFLTAQFYVKNVPALQETPVQFLGQEDPLEKG